MKYSGATLKDVQEIYSGPVRRLWVLCMGEQIHAGGYQSSMDLATRAEIKSGMKGIDLCCCIGGGMRFLAKNFNAIMTGVDATEPAIEEGRKETAIEKLSDRLTFIKGDVTQIALPDGGFDFVWGEDAWCYVEDKDRLIGEAARMLKPGGIIAFTDWIEGPAGLTDEEAFRINDFMKFPMMESLEGYTLLMKKHGFQVKEASYIDFAKYVDLYLAMLTEQLTYDALRILGDDMQLFQQVGQEFGFIQKKTHENGMTRGQFIGIRI